MFRRTFLCQAKTAGVRISILRQPIEKLLAISDRAVVDRNQNRSGFFRQLRRDVADMETTADVIAATKIVSHEQRRLVTHSYSLRPTLQHLLHCAWVQNLGRVLRGENNIKGATTTSTPTSTRSSSASLSSASQKKNKLSVAASASVSTKQLQHQSATSTVTPAQISLDDLDDILFWWREAGTLSLRPEDALQLVEGVTKDNSSVNRLLQCLILLATPPFGSEMGRYVRIANVRGSGKKVAAASNQQLQAQVDQAVEESRKTMTKEACDKLSKRYVEVKSNLLRSLEETRKRAWQGVDSDPNDATTTAAAAAMTQQQLRTRILDAVAAGSSLARDSHLLPPRDAEQILTAVHHCLSGCVSSDGRTCFVVSDFLGNKESILPFVFSHVAKARDVDPSWADRALSLVFGWIAAFARVGKCGPNQGDADKLVRFALTIAAKQGIPLSLIVKSSLLNEVMSFFGLVSCLSVPILRPVAKMMTADTLRDLFYRQQQHQQFGAKMWMMNSAQLVTILPFIALYIPQVAAEVAGALAKQTSSPGTATSNTHGGSKSEAGLASPQPSSPSSSSTGLAAVPSIMALIAERFKLLCNGKWLEINAETRETVSSILLADLIDPSMTTQTVQLLTQHPDKIPAFFTALFNWGISDLALTRLKIIYDRIPADVRAHQHYVETKDYCRDLKQVADSCSVFIPESNVRQGTHAERSCAIIRTVADPLVAGALESLNDFSDPADVWTLFASVYKLFANACISADVSQRAVATIGVYFKHEERLRTALAGKVENVLLLLQSGQEDAYTSSFLSMTAKKQIADPLLSIIVEKLNAEQQQAAMEGIQHFASVDDLFSSFEGASSENINKEEATASTSKAPTKTTTKKQSKKKNQSSVALSGKQDHTTDTNNNNINNNKTPGEKSAEQVQGTATTAATGSNKNEAVVTWKSKHSTIFSALITGQFITSSSAKIPTELAPPAVTTESTTAEALEWLEVMKNCALTVDAVTTNSSSVPTTTSMTSQPGKDEAASKKTSSLMKNLKTNNINDPALLPPFSLWLRRHAEPYVELLVEQRAVLSAKELVKTFAAVDKLGLTYSQVLDAFADQTCRLVEDYQQQQENHEPSSPTTGSITADELLNDIMKSNNNNNSTDQETKSTTKKRKSSLSVTSIHEEISSAAATSQNSGDHQLQQHDDAVDSLFALGNQQNQAPERVDTKTRLEFITAVANSTVRTFPEQIVRDTMSIFEGLHNIEKSKLTFDEVISLGIAAGTLYERRAGAADVSGAASSTAVSRSSLGCDFSDPSHREILASTIRRVAAAAVITTATATSSTSSQQQHQQQQDSSFASASSKNSNSNQSSSASAGSLLTAATSFASASSSMPLTPSQAIGLLRALSVSPVSQNSVFATLVAVVDQARKSAPLLEADVLSLCSIVSDMSRRSSEGVLSLTSSVDLDVARSAAQDALAQLLRFLVRSKSLDRVKEFGRLLDAVVTVLSTSIELHTMQELAASAMSRAQRGQLTAVDVETILRIITNRLSVAPHLGQQLSRSTLPDLRHHVSTQSFPTMSARAACNSLYLVHQCYPLQHCSTTEIDFIVAAFEKRIMDVGKQLDAPSIAMLCVVYQDIHRSSTLLQHSLKHLASKVAPHTVTLKQLRDIAIAIVALKAPHREAMSFLEKRLIQIFEDRANFKVPTFVDPTCVADSIAVFAPNRNPQLGDAVAKIMTALFTQQFTAVQASSVAHSLALLGVRNAAVYNRLLSLVYGERRGSLFSNPTVVSNLLFVFDALQREVHPDLYDLIVPRRSQMLQ